MQEIKFLCDDLKINTTCEECLNFENIENVFFYIIDDIEVIGSIDGKNMNYGIYSNINPDDNLITLNFKVLFEGERFEVDLHKQTYKIKDIHLDTLEVLIISNEKSDKLYEFKILIKNILKKYFKEIHIIRDDENELLCTKLYHKIHKIENLFRSAINNYMLRKYGISWFKNNIVGDYQSKVNIYSQWYNRKYGTFRDIRHELFNLQTDDLIKMLKSSYIDQLSKPNIESINKLKEILGENAATVIKEKYIGLESIWETDISSLLPNDFVDIWEEFSKMRNMIAHNKPICNDLKRDIEAKVEDLSRIITTFENRINSRLKSIEKKEVERIEHEMHYELECEEAGISTLKDKDDVLNEIYENEEWYSFWGELEEHLSQYKTKVEDLSCSLLNIFDDNTFSDYTIEEIKRYVKSIYEILESISIEIGEYRFNILDTIETDAQKHIVLSDLINILEMCSQIEEKIIYTKTEDLDGFENLLFNFNDLLNNNIQIVSLGDIYPEHGCSNDLDIILTFNGERIGLGKIEITYGDYEMNFDQGYNMPILEDELGINLDEINVNLRQYFEEEIKKIDRYYNIINNSK